MKKPNIFICGSSGSGKTTSLRNLDTAKTLILNTERKQLPFPKAGLFKRHKYVEDLKMFNEDFGRALASNAEYIIIDSFTSLAEFIMLEAKRTKRGYDVFAWYAEELLRIISMSKNSDKYIIFTGIDETEIDECGLREKQIKVEGKKLKGFLEKEFVIVLFTSVVRTSDNKFEYQFITNADGIRTAKSPMSMLPHTFPNDLNAVVNQVEKYYNKETIN